MRYFTISFYIFLLISINFLVSKAKAQEEKPVDQYLQTAAENNPQLKSLFNQYLAALEEVPQVGALPDPQVTFAYFAQPMETPMGIQRANFSISQLFPWFGTLPAQERVAAEKAKVKLQAFEDAKLELFRQVRVTYNDLYYLQKTIEITQTNLKLLASFKELARINFESAKAGFADVLRVEMEEQELQNKLQYLQDSQQPVQARFEQLLNVNLKEPIHFPDSLWEEQLVQQKSDVFQTILAENPQLKGLEHEANAYENQIEAARKMGLPSFNLEMSYTNIAPQPDVDIAKNGKDAIIFPQLGIRVPLYRKKYKAMERQAQLQQEATVLSKESQEDQLHTALENLYRDYLDAQRKVKLYRSLSDLAARTLGLLQTEFSTGKTDFEEIIRAERQLLNYQLELEKARTEQNNSVYSIHYLMGK